MFTAGARIVTPVGQRRWTCAAGREKGGAYSGAVEVTGVWCNHGVALQLTLGTKYKDDDLRRS